MFVNFLERTVQVLDDYGFPIKGATVLFAPGVGAATDASGNVTVKAISGTQEITFSFIGRQTRVFRFNDLPRSIRLSESGIVGDEVIIIGTNPPLEVPPKKDMDLIWPILGISVLGLLLLRSPTTTEQPSTKTKSKPITKKKPQPVSVTL